CCLRVQSSGHNMSQWEAILKLSKVFLEKVLDVYNVEILPVSVRQYLAIWIESQDWKLAARDLSLATVLFQNLLENLDIQFSRFTETHEVVQANGIRNFKLKLQGKEATSICRHRRFLETELPRRCSDTDNDPDRCSVAVWSLESCHTDSSPATNDPEVPGNQGKHRHGIQGKHQVTKRGPAALSYPMFTLVTSEDIAGSVSHTPIQRCQQESSDEIKFWTLFSDQRSSSRGLIVGRCHA
ncbi:unnamed protein product, partial [Ranitomeya imitator]